MFPSKNLSYMRQHVYALFCSFLFLHLVFDPASGSDKITLEQIYLDRMFVPSDIESMQPMNDGDYYAILENSGYIVICDYLTGKIRDTIFSPDMFYGSEIPVITDFSFNDDESVILLTSERKEIFRHSFSSNYYIFQRENKNLMPVYSEGEQQLATISPDGQNVSFVYKNNLYIKNIETKNITKVTSDGLLNSIINGMPDWVYEEEFTLTTGHYWSPDSRKIAFYKFDESNVKEFNLTLYENLYPEWFAYRYPKAGEKNARADIYVYDIVNGSEKKMDLGENEEKYIPRIKWLTDSKELCVVELNRLQNEIKIHLLNISTGVSKIFYKESNAKYISECTDDFVTFFDSGEKALIMSEKDGFMHLYQYKTDGTLINQVTIGKWELDRFYGIDEKSRTVYYSSTEVSPLERHIYSVDLDGGAKTKISQKKGVNLIQFNSDFSYYLLVHSDANTPYEYTIYDREGKVIRILEDNARLKKLTRQFDFIEKEFFSFRPEHGVSLNGYKIMPVNFNRGKKYPVLIYVYGGPESQLVLDEWNYRLPWFQLLAQKGYIIVCVDNRGTNGRGEEFKKSTYLQLGKLETEDQICLAEYLSELSYVDANRIGIFGWSYGGYMSLLCLMKGNDKFKMGIAVAPVTSWRYYDTIYTERFLRRPEDNPEGYDENSPLNFVDRLNGKLLLVHGMADDNVHFQNSAMLINKLVEADKQFDGQFYPNKNHFLYGGNTTYHLYKRMTDYILNTL